jgi:hypothetical protein
VGAVAQDVGQVSLELFDGLRAGRRGQVVHKVVEFVAVGSELAKFGGEVADAVATSAFVEGAVFEGGQVAVDRRLGRGDLCVDGFPLGPVLAAVGGAQLPLGLDRVMDEVGALVEVDQCLGDGVVDEIGVDARRCASDGAVAGAGEARVVAVAAQFCPSPKCRCTYGRTWGR